MGQEQRDKSAPDVPVSEVNDRREFIRQSLGVAPLMLTLGGSGKGGGTSMHGTLWSSLGTKWKHKGDWTARWRWTKGSGDKYRGREKLHENNKETPAEEDWNWGQKDAQWRHELEAESRRKDTTDWDRRETHTTGRSYDWRKDQDWKRSEGLSPLASDRTKRRED